MQAKKSDKSLTEDSYEGGDWKLKNCEFSYIFTVAKANSYKSSSIKVELSFIAVLTIIFNPF